MKHSNTIHEDSHSRASDYRQYKTVRSPSLSDMERSASTLQDSFTTATVESPYSSNSSSKELSPDVLPGHRGAGWVNEHPTYGNITTPEPTEYENMPKYYNRQSSGDSRKSSNDRRGELSHSDSSSSNDKMVFVQPIAHMSSEANKLVVNKVEPPSSTKPRTLSDSNIRVGQSVANQPDIVNVSKQATVKEIRCSSSSSERRLSYTNAVRESSSDSDTERLPAFIPPVVKSTSPQKAFTRQRSREGNSNSSYSDHSKSTSPDLKKSRTPEPIAEVDETSRTLPRDTHAAEQSSTVLNASLVKADIPRDISSDSVSDDKPSSHSSSLASLSNVVALCGSTEDLEISDSDVFAPKTENGRLYQNNERQSTTKEPGFSTGSGNSDLMKDITSTLDQALSSMDEVMSRKLFEELSLDEPADKDTQSKKSVRSSNQKTASSKGSDSSSVTTHSTTANGMRNQPVETSFSGDVGATTSFTIICQVIDLAVDNLTLL